MRPLARTDTTSETELHKDHSGQPALCSTEIGEQKWSALCATEIGTAEIEFRVLCR